MCCTLGAFFIWQLQLHLDRAKGPLPESGTVMQPGFLKHQNHLINLCAVVAAYKGNAVTMIGKHADKMKLLPAVVTTKILSKIHPVAFPSYITDDEDDGRIPD